jgi:hypothetical protein
MHHPVSLPVDGDTSATIANQLRKTIAGHNERITYSTATTVPVRLANHNSQDVHSSPTHFTKTARTEFVTIGTFPVGALSAMRSDQHLPKKSPVSPRRKS